MENDVQLQRREMDEEQMAINKRMAEVRLDMEGKINCLFNPQDPIFQLKNETVMPSEEEKEKLVAMARLAGLPFMCDTCCKEVKIKSMKFC